MLFCLFLTWLTLVSIGSLFKRKEQFLLSFENDETLIFKSLHLKKRHCHTVWRDFKLFQDFEKRFGSDYQPWDFFGRNDAKAETPVLWPPHVKS